jgi:hypothetical protein
MGIVNDLWWLTGVLLAAKPALVGVRMVEGGDPLGATGWFALAVVALLLPEYVKRELFGGPPLLSSLPVVGGRFGGD